MALSTENGRITVDWRIDNKDEQPRLVFQWIETGMKLSGDKPKRKGFGTELLERTLAYDLKGQATLEFRQDGPHATVSLPAVERIIMGSLR
ncbi:MAG TPA: hypothetical protein VGN97_08690 [Mesorhizobium sp.]|jgi:two-component system CheB/CheR fusion protein|nr:hypothetical protein [Mesorhizobium sp.]